MSFAKVRLDASFTKNNKSSDSRNKIIYQYKIIMLGEVAVGKTSLLKRFVDNDFSKEYKCTIGVEFRLKTIDISDSVGVELKIWDTCGAEKYRVITRQYYRDAPGVILVFDLTNKDSFINLGEWLNDIKLYAPENVSILLIGNKSDMIEEREVKKESIIDFCKANGNLNYIEASAKKGTKVELLFNNMAKCLVEKEKDKEKERKGMMKTFSSYGSPLSSTMLNQKIKEMNHSEATCCS